MTHMMQRRSLLVFGLVALLGVACSSNLGKSENPIKLMLVPSQAGDMSAEAGQELADLLAEETGYSFSVKVPERYIDLVAAIGDFRADVAFMNDMAYLLAHDEFGAEAAFEVLRGADATSYKGMIITHQDSGIEQLADLAGKKVAYVDVHSVGGYLMPAMLLREKGITPGEQVAAGSHEDVVRMVYEEKVDAGYAYFNPPPSPEDPPADARSRIAEEHPDVFDQVWIVTTTDDIPNEPIVFRKGVDDAIKQNLGAAFEKLFSTAEGRSVMQRLNQITGIKPVEDAAYQPLRKALDTLGKSSAEMMALKPEDLLRLQEKETAPPPMLP